MSVVPKNVIRVFPPKGPMGRLAALRDHPAAGAFQLTDDDFSVTTSGERLGCWMGYTLVAGFPADHGEVADEAAMLGLDNWAADSRETPVYHYVVPGDSCTRADDPGYRWHCLRGHGRYLTDWERRPLPGPIADLASRANALEIEMAGKIGSSALDGFAPLDSPAFTGAPTCPTPTAAGGIATKGYVDTAVGNASAGGYIGAKDTVAALLTGYNVGSYATVATYPNAVFFAMATPTTEARNWGMVTTSPAVVAYYFYHPGGRFLNTSLDLASSGTKATFAFIDRSDVYGYGSGYRALYVNGNSSSSSLRHSSFICYIEAFAANNLDWAWKLVSAGSGTYYVQNPYSDYYLGYDTGTDTLRIVPQGDSRVVAWTLTPA